MARPSKHTTLVRAIPTGVKLSHGCTRTWWLSALISAAVVSGCGPPAARSQRASVTPVLPAPSTSAPPPALPPASAAPSPVGSRHATTGAPPTARASATLPAAASTPPRLVAQLPTDRPWVWTASRACRYRAGQLIAVGADGSVVRFAQAVMLTIERAGQAPLLVTCGSDTSLSLVDPHTATALPLAFPPHTVLGGPISWSPDASAVVLTAFSDAPEVPAKSGYQLYRIEIATGVVHQVVDDLSLPEWVRGSRLEAVAWGTDGIVVRAWASATSGFWRVDPFHNRPTPHELVTIGHTAGWAIDPGGHWLAHRYVGNAPLLRKLQTGAERTLAGSTPALAPDGSRVAYLAQNPSSSSQCCVLHIEQTDGSDPIVVPLIPTPTSQSSETMRLAWMTDGTRVLVFDTTRGQSIGDAVVQMGATRLWMVEPDGTILHTVLLPDAVSHWFASTDRLLVIERGREDILRTLTLGSEPQSTGGVALPTRDVESTPQIVYAP